MGKEDNLTPKQDAFAIAYVDCLNATRAAEIAGYSGNDNALGVIGHRNLRNVKIKQRINELSKALIMEKSEVLLRLSQQARADIAECFDFDGDIPRLDMRKAKALGATHQIKSIRYNAKNDSYAIDLWDTQKALDLLARHYDLLSNSVSHDGEITVRFKYEDD